VGDAKLSRLSPYGTIRFGMPEGKLLFLLDDWTCAAPGVCRRAKPIESEAPPSPPASAVWAADFGTPSGDSDCPLTGIGQPPSGRLRRPPRRLPSALSSRAVRGLSGTSRLCFASPPGGPLDRAAKAHANRLRLFRGSAPSAAEPICSEQTGAMWPIGEEDGPCRSATLSWWASGHGLGAEALPTGTAWSSLGDEMRQFIQTDRASAQSAAKQAQPSRQVEDVT